MIDLTAAPLEAHREILAAVRFDERTGLVPAVVQDQASGAVLMVAFMDAEALKRTIDTGRTWLWSRSRQQYWCKGETSGDRQYVRDMRLDCDGDTVLLTVEQAGRGACHTGSFTCFDRTLAHSPTAS